jgi:hypothetical protein
MVSSAQSDDAATARQLEQQFAADVLPLLKAHCFACHGAEKQEGKLKLSDFASSAAVAAQPHIWQRVLERLQAGDMPPEDARSRSRPSGMPATPASSWLDG